MDIKKVLENGKLTFSLKGKIDTTTAPQLQDALVSSFDEGSKIVLDFADVAYVSSAGLRVLLLGAKTAKAKGASMTLCNVSNEIMEVFEMTGFSDILQIE